MGSCVLLPLIPNTNKVQILLVGGSTSLSPNNNTPATDIPEIFTVNLNDLNSSSGWEKTHSDNFRRILCDSVLLPYGTVLVTNGAQKGVADSNKEAVSDIEVFDPNSQTNPWEKIGMLERDRLF